MMSGNTNFVRRASGSLQCLFIEGPQRSEDNVMQTRHRATHGVMTAEKLNIWILLQDLNENQLTYFARTSRELTGQRRRQRGRLHVQLTFLCISFPSLHIYNVKFPHRTFHGERKLTLHDEFSLSF